MEDPLILLLVSYEEMALAFPFDSLVATSSKACTIIPFPFLFQIGRLLLDWLGNIRFENH